MTSDKILNDAQETCVAQEQAHRALHVAFLSCAALPLSLVQFRAGICHFCLS